MNREIKFRAWDKEYKKFWHDFRIHPFGMVFPALDDDSGKWNYDNTYKQERIILQQFTGLLDKNGKEIYEGDIVEQFVLSDKGQRGEVKFGSYANPFNSDKFTGHIGFYVEWNNNLTRKDLGYWTGHGVDIEVIGNIYENP